MPAPDVNRSIGIFDQPTRRTTLALLAGIPACGAWAQRPATTTAVVTIVEGEATAIDGARTLLLREGQRLGRESIVRTDSATRLLRLEWPDGSVADFGPDTQAMLEPPGLAPRGGPAPAVYLLRGWLKLSSLGGAKTAGLAAPTLQVQPFEGALVVMTGAEETWVFAESAGASLSERDQRAPKVLTLAGGEVYQRSGRGPGAIAPRSTPAQMQRVPRGFRDTLPLRMDRFKDAAPAPQPGSPPSYAELREWLLAEPAIRRNFTRRFRERTRDAAFRNAMAERIRDHPEWEPILFPERFVKPASAPR